MPETRLFELEDVEPVARLWQKCFRRSSRPPSVALQQYFIDVFMRGPWYHPDYRPLVYVSGKTVIGFLGRMHRPMTFKGAPIHCAVASQLMVDPDQKNPFCVFELVRALHAGPQDLAYSDGANEVAGRLWARCSGEPCRLLSLEWSRSLRPAQAFFDRLREHESVGSFARLLQPCSGLFDAVAVRSMPRLYHKPCAPAPRGSATAAEILPLLKRVATGVSLAPDYTSQSLAWLMERASQARSFGLLRSQVVMNRQAQPVGWFVYFVRPGRRAQVLQAGALPGEGKRVLAALFRDAWEQDAASVSGQLDPLLMADLSEAHCRFHLNGFGVLVQSKNPELIAALHGGDALISRLDGEWWMRFGIDRKSEW